MKFFVMADIHSFYDEMIVALDLKGFDKDNPDHILVVCGDLFDRGPAAVKVFEYVRELANQNRLIYVRGNHEDLLFECVDDLVFRGRIDSHHFSNGTLDTIAQFSGVTKYDIYAGVVPTTQLLENISPVLGFIRQNSVNYAIIGNYVCTHGWIPPEVESKDFLEIGDANSNNPDHEAAWQTARWLNGMSWWKDGHRLDGYTIICGHWQTSWGHKHIHQDREEFPQKNQEDWQKSFEPFVDDGIIALDACTVYSGFCNCYVIER